MPTEVVSAKTYVKTFAALFGLLILTVGANFVNLGPFNILVALAISVAKGTLIMLFFMEVRYSHPIVWLFASAAFLWLVILLAITMTDYISRPWTTGPVWTQELRGSNKIEFAHPPAAPAK